MVISTKRPSEQDGNQTLQGSYNDVDSTLSVNGFLVGKVGHKVIMTIATTTVPNDTEIFNFYDSANLLYTFTIIYTDGSRDVFLSAERTA